MDDTLRRLSAPLAPQFPPWIQERGEALRQTGVVELVDSGPGEAELRVRDELPWTVVLRRPRDERPLFMACNCPAGRRGSGRCRHLWAALRFAEAAGLLTEPVPGHGSSFRHLELPPPPLPDLPHAGSAPPAAPPAPTWRERLRGLRPSFAAREPAAPDDEAAELLYVIDVATSLRLQSLTLELQERRRLPRGGWGKPRPVRVTPFQAQGLPEGDEREALALLLGSSPADTWNTYRGTLHGREVGPRVALVAAVARVALPRLCRTGRCRLRSDARDPEPAPLGWDAGPPWELRLAIEATGEDYELGAHLLRGTERRTLDDARLMLDTGLVCFAREAALLDAGGLLPWVPALRSDQPLRVPRAEADELLEELMSHVARPERVDLPEELRLVGAPRAPRPQVVLRRDVHAWRGARLTCALVFDYGGRAPLRADDPQRAVVDLSARRLHPRDRVAEQAARQQLLAAGVRAMPGVGGALHYEVRGEHAPRVVRALVAQGFRVDAEGEVYRRAGAVRVGVTSGVDWFDLEGSVDFDGRVVPLPKVLASLRRGHNLVALGDGEHGVLPEEWFERLRLMARVTPAEGGRVRFGAGQVGLLDALLASIPEAGADAAFATARARLHAFEGLRAEDPPPGFRGELRAYQREGLGFLRYLDEFGFGGCLADDMGLGKTVQVLALLEARRAAGLSRGASLAVVPRSLVFNWKSEAARFTPGLRVRDHTGLGRVRQPGAFDDCDLALTTYGTLRRDAVLLKDIEFDYVVLDEAQAIKNAASETAKATRLLRARRRLALSGTPVENHLGELLSLFGFLEPALFGRATGLDRLAADSSAEGRALLARSLRPFVLRRTKEQVARDLPPKTEQTLLVELPAAQRALYDEIRDHYRASLLRPAGHPAARGGKLHVLEALLRLRQAACHPGLLDPARAGEGGTKLDALLPLLAEVREEGHKALVFSQFTSLLALLRPRLEAQGLTYEYLDGKTRDRAARVARFQDDDACGLFLVSLKAGGLGLNLTAAEYVFLLDPWWNPAVEAQAVDRAHRIGQERAVFAYRLIAKDTVEEKVLALQERKRQLADAIFTGDGSLLSQLTREDLELLLS